jgi:hypothetical protein
LLSFLASPALLAAALAFFLPWYAISCGGMHLASGSGFDAATSGMKMDSSGGPLGALGGGGMSSLLGGTGSSGGGSGFGFLLGEEEEDAGPGTGLFPHTSPFLPKPSGLPALHRSPRTSPRRGSSACRCWR